MQLRRIVVVVPAHNERDRLPECLASLSAAAERVPVPVTSVVVLDSCTDGSEAVVRHSFTAVSVAAANVGAARAEGFARVAGGAGRDTWFATTDADSVVSADWLVNQMVHHRHGAEAVVGMVSVDWSHHSPRTRRRYEQRYGRAGNASPHGHVHGANLGIRADVYWRVGGFRSLERGEDVDLVSRLAGAGARLAWDRNSPVLTSDRTDSRVTGGFGDYVKDLVG